MSMDSLPDYLSIADLESLGLTPEDVRRLCPGAVELVALDGTSCWAREDLAALWLSRDGKEST